jgi:hypothetical protein
MNPSKNAATLAPLQRLVDSISGTESALEAIFLYDDPASRQWAGETRQQLGELLPDAGLRTTWWNVGDFFNPGVLAGAVFKAMRAHLIVVATSGAEGMPLPFYFWVNSWLPHHGSGNTLLMGMLGEVEVRNSHSGRLRKYLRTLARRGRLECLIEERAQAETPAVEPSGFHRSVRLPCVNGCEEPCVGRQRTCCRR